ncbi:response regulator [Rhodospirillaceae bacterium KN72]|uniref:histidine kinase n=1 Tax=Pacificispira spongiicola TaxID=2729598 RepID=A0A7Y0DZK0_9PROT|nr:ATP-binding protein [Pacificispira spongiicola]NMM44475.1 response regulator [Pacificispira spongiicola]
MLNSYVLGILAFAVLCVFLLSLSMSLTRSKHGLWRIENLMSIALFILLIGLMGRIGLMSGSGYAQNPYGFYTPIILGGTLLMASTGYLLYRHRNLRLLEASLNEVLETQSLLRDRAALYRRTLHAMMGLPQDGTDDGFKAEVLRMAAEALGIERAAIWLGTITQGNLHCDGLYIVGRGVVPAAGLVLTKENHPDYFSALDENHVLAVADCWTDPRTASFKSGYLPETGVKSLCDVQTPRIGGIEGVVCFESVRDNRHWTTDDIAFVQGVGELILLRIARQKLAAAEQAVQLRDARFRDYSMAASDLFWECDENLVFTYLSAKDDTLNLDASLVGRKVSDMPGYDPASERWRAFLERLSAKEPFRDVPITTEKADKSQVLIAVSAIPVMDEAGHFKGFRGAGRDIRGQFREETVREAIQVAMTGSVGEGFFDELVRCLIDMGYDLAILGQVPRDRRSEISILSWASSDETVTIQQDDLLQGPCRSVLKGDFVFVRNNVTDVYPDDESLRRFGLVSYAGMPLVDNTGMVIGVLLAMRRKPLTDEEMARSVLTVFTIRASGELRRLRNEEEKSSLQNQLLHAQRMETMGALAGGIAHDFNNVLTPILGYAGMLAEDFEEGTSAHEDAVAIVRGAKRAKAMVEQILAFSRRSDAEQKIAFDPTKLIAGSLKFVKATIPPKIELTSDIAEDTPKIVGDPNKFDQVLMNLVTNAYQAFDDQEGRIDVVVRPTYISEDFAAVHPPIVPGPALRLNVTDTGSGIPPDVLQKVFEPFFTTKGSGRGTGFGLSTCRGIVEAMNGTILVDTKPGRGTTFTVLIPAYQKSAATLVVDEDPAAAPVKADGPVYRVVYVDDEVENNAVTVKLLERAGHSVRSFADPTAATTFLKTHPMDVDVLITDDSMPKMQGYEVAEAYRTARPDAAIVVVSGASGAVLKERYAEAGVNTFVQKPFVVSELLDGMEAAMSGR